MCLVCHISRSGLHRCVPLSRSRGAARAVCASLALLLGLLGGAPTQAAESPWKLDLHWDDGVDYELTRRLPGASASPLGFRDEIGLRGRIGARLYADFAGYFSQNDILTSSFDAGARKARLYTRGELLFLYRIEYKFEFGLADQELFFNDGYFRFDDVPILGKIQLGVQDAPFGLDTLMASAARPFMESGLPNLAMSPGTKAGLLFGGPLLDQRLTWAFGVFTNSGRQAQGSDTKTALSGALRVTGLPIVGEKADEWDWVHLGLGVAEVLAQSDGTRYRARPETFLSNFVVDTGEIESGRRATLLGLEFAAARGPLALQGELIGSTVSRDEGRDLLFSGFYFQAAFTLTGESHPYSRASGLPARLAPRLPFSPFGGGLGAFEVAARIAYLDLSDGPVRGGRLAQAGGVVSWYWNDHVRLMLDGSVGRRTGGSPSGWLGVIQTRIEIDY